LRPASAPTRGSPMAPPADPGDPRLERGHTRSKLLFQERQARSPSAQTTDRVQAFSFPFRHTAQQCQCGGSADNRRIGAPRPGGPVRPAGPRRRLPAPGALPILPSPQVARARRDQGPGSRARIDRPHRREKAIGGRRPASAMWRARLCRPQRVPSMFQFHPSSGSRMDPPLRLHHGELPRR